MAKFNDNKDYEFHINVKTGKLEPSKTPIRSKPIVGPMDDVYDHIIQQEQKQLQRKYKEQLKGGYTNTDIEKLGDLTESGAHWETNPLSRSKKWARLKENEGMQAARNDTSNRVFNIVGEENAIRTNAAKKLKDAIKLKQGESERNILQQQLRENIANKRKKIDTITEKTLKNALEEVIKEDTAATKINRVMRGHLGRKDYKFVKSYPERVRTRQEQVQSNIPSNDLTLKPRKSDSTAVIEKKDLDKSKYEQALKSNKISKNLQNITANDAAITLQNAIRNKQARKEVKQQRVANNLGKLAKGSTDKLKQAWKQATEQHRKTTSNFGQLTQRLQQQQHQQRLDAAAIRPADILGVGGTTRTGTAFGATEAQLNAPSRMQLHRERNPELTQLRQQISDNARGRLQLTDLQKEGIKTRIQQLVEINKALKAKGQGPKLGRPEGSKKK